MAGFPRPFGRYTLDAAIGMGGMAEVFLAHTAYQGFHKVCCIKRVLPHLDSQEFIDLFHNEAAIVAQLRHTNIVQVFDFGECDGVLYLAMEYIKGADLWAMMRQAAALDTRFGVGPSLQIIKGLCRGLHHAHTRTDAKTPLNIVVADVSPQNLLISDAGEVKLTDFGVAKAALRATPAGTQDNVMRGKVPYAAPEQILGHKLTHHVDQFATGVILWELLTGRRLFPGEDAGNVARKILCNNVPKPSRHNRDVPPILDRIVLKALALKPQNRYADMHALEQAVSRFLLQHFTEPSTLSVSGLIKRLRAPDPTEEPNLGIDTIDPQAKKPSFWRAVRSWIRIGAQDERSPGRQCADNNPPIPPTPPFLGTQMVRVNMQPPPAADGTAEQAERRADQKAEADESDASRQEDILSVQPQFFADVPPPMAFAEALEYLAPLVLAIHRDHPDLPPMPRCAQQVIEVVNRDDTEIIDVARVVQQDTAIAKEVLRVANSAVYRGAREVTSVRDAVVRMGLTEATGLAAATAARALFMPQGKSVLEVMPERWATVHHHCLLSGFGCSRLATQLSLGDPGEAFLAGLFHDIGKVSALQALCLLVAGGFVPFPLTPALIDRILEALHVDLGCEALMHWGLPSFLFDICAEHHDDELENGVSPILHIVRVVSSINALRTNEFVPPGLEEHMRASATALGLKDTNLRWMAQQLAALEERVDVIIGGGTARHAA